MLEQQHIEKLVLISDIQELADDVYNQIGNPVSIWMVAATMESLGVRDIDALNKYGCENVFELAEEVYASIRCRVREENGSDIQYQALEIPLFSERLVMFIKYYFRGLFFSFPMLSQIAAILIFRYSLWAWIEFNEAQATVVAFGTIAAFIVTGGFTQTLGRSVTKYRSENNYRLAFQATNKIIRGGGISAFIVAVFFYLLNFIIPFYPHDMMMLGLIYYMLISLLLLFSGVLYALEQRLMILLIMVGGTAVVIVGMDLYAWGIYRSHWVGIGVTIVLLFLYAYGYLQFKIQRNLPAAGHQKLPDASVRYYINYRHFIYGFLYFFFLFLDRVLAWSAGPPPPPYIMWFNTPYELGMDWALISLILTIAVLEYSINAFSKQLLPLQKKAGFFQLREFNHFFQKFYRRQIIILAGVGVISIITTFYGINSLRIFKDEIPEIRDFFLNPMTTKVFWIAGISYLFVVIGLLHSLFFFTLNKPSFAVYAITGAFVVNFVVGFVCSRTLGLEYAVVGLLAGSITFAAITGGMAKSYFKHLDYYYYSAF